MMTTFFPYFDDQFKDICREIELLPDADIEQLRIDILNCAWGGPNFDMSVTPKQSEIRKMLKGIKTSTDRHLQKINKLYSIEYPDGPDDEMRTFFRPGQWLEPIIEHLEQLKAKADTVLDAAPSKFKPGPLPDQSFLDLIISFKTIYKKYTGEKATSLRPSAGEPTAFQEFVKMCAIGLGEKIVPSFYDKIHDAMLSLER